MTNDKRQILHIDMNSYFATVEQQANPELRGKPVGVKGSEAKRTIIAAASIEAKKFGIKSGMRVEDALELCPELIMVVGEPIKYSSVTKQFIEIFGRYTDKVEIFSIDEAFLDVTKTAHLYVSEFKNLNLKNNCQDYCSGVGVKGWIPAVARMTREGVDSGQLEKGSLHTVRMTEEGKGRPFCHSGIASQGEQYPESMIFLGLDPPPERASARAGHCPLRLNHGVGEAGGEDDKVGDVILRTEGTPESDSGQARMTTKEDFSGAIEIARRIKADIRREIGEWLTCSVGVAPNKFLAKLGSDLEKPDGLVVITEKNKDEILLSCELTDFCGIASRIEARLNLMEIITVKDLREADDLKLKKEFGTYGLKIKRMSLGIDNSEVLDWHEQADAKSFGHSRTLNKDVTDMAEIKGQLYLLSEKVAKRMRDEKYFGKEVGVWIRYKDFSGVSKRHRIGYWVNDGYEIYKAACGILDEIYFNCHSGIAPRSGQYPESRNSLKLDSRQSLSDSMAGGNDKREEDNGRKIKRRKGSLESLGMTRMSKKPIRAMGVYVTRISKNAPQYLFKEDKKRERIVQIMDDVNNRFGENTLFKGVLLNFSFKRIVSGMGRKKF